MDFHEEPKEEQDPPLPLSWHLKELRSLVVRSGLVIGLVVLIVFCFADKMVFFLTKGLGELSVSKNGIEIPWILLGPLDALLISFRISFLFGLFLSAPIWGRWMLGFILPALYQNEKKVLLGFSVVLFFAAISGLTVGYFFSLPKAALALHQFNRSFGKELWLLSKAIDFSLAVLAAHALAFILGATLIFLAWGRFLNYGQLKSYRKGFILVAFILGALLTPPDVLTQILFALPLMLCFELAVWLSWMLESKKAPKEKWLK